MMTEDVPQISEEELNMFRYVTESHDPSLGLIAGTCNGEPTTIIVRVEEVPSILVGGKPGMNIYPLYVAVTPRMKLIDARGEEPKDESDVPQNS